MGVLDVGGGVQRGHHALREPGCQLVVQDIESDTYPAYLRENWRRHASLVRQPFGGPGAADVGVAGTG